MKVLRVWWIIWNKYKQLTLAGLRDQMLSKVLYNKDKDITKLELNKSYQQN